MSTNVNCGLQAACDQENIGGDYNLDGVLNDHPNFIGPSAGAKSTNIAACNAAFGVTTANAIFVNPPGYGVTSATWAGICSGAPGSMGWMDR